MDHPTPASRVETFLMAFIGLAVIALFVAFFMARPPDQSTIVSQGPTLQAAWSPDGARVITTGGDTTIIWDAESGAKLRELHHPLGSGVGNRESGFGLALSNPESPVPNLQSQAPASGDQPRELMLAHVLAESHPVHQAMVILGAELEKRSQGRMRLTIHANGTLGDEKTLIQKCQLGELHLTKTSTSTLESFHEAMGVFSLPYLFRDETHYWAVLEGEIGRELLAAAVPAGLRGLCYYDAGARSIYARKPITDLASLSGRSIRVQQSDTMISAMEALGLVPQDIAWGAELYQALKSGRVEAAENNAPSYFDASHYESAPYYYLDRHSMPPDVLVVSEPFWRKLSARERLWLQESADAGAPEQRARWRSSIEDIHRKLEAQGVTITRNVDAAPFQAAVQPLYQRLAGARKALVERIRAVK